MKNVSTFVPLPYLPRVLGEQCANPAAAALNHEHEHEAGLIWDATETVKMKHLIEAILFVSLIVHTLSWKGYTKMLFYIQARVCLCCTSRCSCTGVAEEWVTFF